MTNNDPEYVQHLESALNAAEEEIKALESEIAEQRRLIIDLNDQLNPTYMGEPLVGKDAKRGEPVAWIYDFSSDGETITDWITTDYDEAHSPTNRCHNIRPLYLAPQPTPADVGDAKKWREYQSKKQRLINAGFGKSPLRDAAIAKEN